ncbi:membrane protein [Advenella kashmirensis W13003]|uniref:Membrane protein n=1 Tax=Advenella kashmirensis W13003 TaxID=1424334 RepID=V8QNI5_9BURK|nr:membrane protein [Advenella kashmirensis W13003]
MASADEAFLKKAAEAGHAEVEAGKLAKQKASSADVKTFAEHMVTDHTKVNDELNALATNKGVELPAGPSSAQQAELKALGEESEEFDKQYVDRMAVTAHEEAVNMFKDASETSEDVDVKTFAKKTLPSLESHLDMAKSLKTKVGSDK